MALAITQTLDDRCSMKTATGDNLVVIKLACVSDGTGSGTYDVGSVEQPNGQDYMQLVRGSWLYMVKLVPGTCGASFDFDVLDENGDAFINTTGNSNTATSWITGSETIGLFPPVIHYLGIVVDGADALTNTNTLDVYMYFTK